MFNLLQVLLQETINKRGASIRGASRQIGVAHTTINRILRGESADIDTLVAICKWIEVQPSQILDSRQEGSEGLGAKIAVVTEMYPQFTEVFAEAMDRLERGEISSDVVADLIAYASYRLSMESYRKAEGDS